MALEQYEIDQLLIAEQEKQQKRIAKENLARTTREKLEQMFVEAMGMQLEDNALMTLEDIGAYIGLMEFQVKPNFKYASSFRKLQASYERKVAKLN